MTFSSSQKPYFGPAASIDSGVRQLLFLFVFIVAIISLWFAGCTYQVIPALEQAASASWTDVHNQYRQRVDLIPNIVAAAQASAKPEKDALTAIAEARTKAAAVNIDAAPLTDPRKMYLFEQAQVQLSDALRRVLAAGENDPDLTSNPNFLALQSQLEGAEKRITAARHGYIEASHRYNIALAAFPTLLWASTVFFAKRPLAEFAAEDAAKPAPPAKF
jgi:LemA protein